MIRKVCLGLTVLAGVSLFAGSQSASAGSFNFRFGGGHDSHYQPRSFYGGGWGGRGHGHHDHGRARRHAHWHDTSHYDYHPGEYVRHRNHYHYVPGHYDFHQEGHWDSH